MPAIFISHSSLDTKVTGDIRAWLEGLNFERVFLDYDANSGIPLGDHWEKRLYEALSRSHAIILVLTRNWMASKWCFAELTQARALGKVVLPVICEPLGERVILPEIQATEMLDWNADGLTRLERRLRAITDELARGFSLDPKRPPYPGIHSFEREDAAIYFGRDDETRSVIERLDAGRTQGGARLLIVIGASGSGKSSLLKAGVLPQLARRTRDWLVLPSIRPEKAPLEILAKSIAQQFGKPDDWRAWHARLGSPEALDHVSELLKDLRTGDARNATVLLPVDQFEEIFTVAAVAERQAFLHLFAAAFDPAHDLPVMVLATGRSDVLEGLIEAENLARFTETYPLAQLPLERVPRLIDGPAAVAGIIVEPGLSERIKRDVESPEALPLLAHTLWLLYRRGGDDKKLSIAEYESLGDAERGLNPIQNSVRLVADQAIGRLRPSEQDLAALRDAFVPHLVRVRLDDGKRVRQPARMSELPAEARRLLRVLVGARLLTVRGAGRSGVEAGASPTAPAADREPAGPGVGAEPALPEELDLNAVVEVAHEALFKAWPMLDDWLTREHAFLSDIERIRNAHDVWQQAPPDQKPRALLQGLLLSRARDWLLRYPQRFAGRDMAAVRAFIVASAEAEDVDRARAEAQRERARRMERRLLQGAVVATIIFAAAAALAGWQYYEASRARDVANTERRIAIARQLFAASQAEESINAECSLNLALAAYDFARQTPGLERLPFESAVRSALALSHVVATLPGEVGNRYNISWRPDGSALAFLADDGKVRIWPAARESTARVLDAINNAHALEWMPDGQQLLVATDSALEFWDPAQSKPAHSIPLQTHDFRAFRWHKDGKRALVWSAGQGTLLIDIEKANVRRMAPKTAVWRGHTWSPDGNFVAVGTETRQVWIIDVEKNSFKRLLHPEPVVRVAWSPDGRTLAVALDGGQIWIWDAIDGGRRESLDGHSNQVTGLDFSADGRSLVSASWDHSLRIWNTRTWRSWVKLTGHTAGLHDARMSRSGEWIASTASDGTVRVWSTNPSRTPQTWLETPGWVWSVAWNADGTLLAAAADREIVVRDAAGKQRQLAKAAEQITAGSWAAAANRYAFVEGKGDITVIDVVSGKIIMHKEAKAARLFDVALSADASQVAVGTLDEVVVFSVPGGEERYRIARGAAALAFSPDDTFLGFVPTDGDTAEIVNAASGKPHLTLPNSPRRKATWGLAWSRDGRRLATASDDGIVRVWDVSTPGPPLQIQGHSSDAKGVVWSPANDRLATASLDGTVRLWALPDGRPLAVMTGHRSGVRSVAWSSDGKTIATGAEDGTARLFLANFADVLALARKQTQVGLSSAERERCLRQIGPGTSLIEDIAKRSGQ
jgi:WD40 repeat protein